jgi:hypothetical protein
MGWPGACRVTLCYYAPTLTQRRIAFMDSALRPMSASQVLDRTFYLYRKNFWLFAGIALITPALSIFMNLAQLWAFGVPMLVDPAKADPQVLQRYFQDTIMRAILGGTLGLSIYAVGYAIASGATVYAVSMLHLGKTTTIREAYSKINPIFGRILGLVVSIFFIAAWPLVLTYGLVFGLALGMPTLLKAGGLGGGGAALVLAGSLLMVAGLFGGIFWFIFAYCRYALAVPACTIENLPIRYSLIRSKFLIRGNMLRVVGIYLLTLLITIAVKGVLQAPAFIVSGVFSLRPGAHISASFLIWIYFSEFVGTMVAGPIATIAMALLYYDERVRKEAFDLQLMMDALGQSGTTTPASAMPASPASV